MVPARRPNSQRLKILANDTGSIETGPENGGFTTLSSRIAYENRWLRVREDIIRRPDGGDGLYGVVERGPFVVIAALRPGADGVPLLATVEQYRYPVRRRLLELPMGMWEDRPDATPEQVAAGELEEETGLVAGRMVHAGILFQGAGYSTQMGHVFLATDLQQRSARREDTEADMTAREIPLPDALAMVGDGRITCMVTIAALGLLRIKGMI